MIVRTYMGDEQVGTFRDIGKVDIKDGLVRLFEAGEYLQPAALINPASFDVLHLDED